MSEQQSEEDEIKELEEILEEHRFDWRWHERSPEARRIEQRLRELRDKNKPPCSLVLLCISSVLIFTLAKLTGIL